MTALAIDETSRARGHTYVSIGADACRRKVIFGGEEAEAASVSALAEDMRAHKGAPESVHSVSIDMSPAYIKGVTENFPKAQITFDKFHVIAQASTAIDVTRRKEQRRYPVLTGMRWVLLEDRDRLNAEQRADLDALVARITTNRTARAWAYRERLREILDRKQSSVVRSLLLQWRTNVMRSKVHAMKAVARMIRSHLEGIVAWARTRQKNGFLEALNGLFQASKRKARGYTHLQTIRTVFFMFAAKLNFCGLNPHLQPT